VTILQWGFTSIQCPTVFTPNGDNVNDFWDVLDLSQAVGFVPAYNATDYELDVYDRWGSLIVILSGSTTTGFANGSIPHWDGVTNQNVFYNWWHHLWGWHDTYAGSPVSDGTYYYIFKMKNCTNGWTTICYGFITVLR
jgi:gliding motility-associated-like protein